MARRPSVVSLSSLGSVSGLLKSIQLPAVAESGPQGKIPNGTPRQPSRTMSINGRMEPALQQTGEAWDADNLFAQHTIAEVKAVQQRLRLDADAKQEELRIMVGERYRDLLQASTSIMLISESSNSVLHNLDAMRKISYSAEPDSSHNTSWSGQGDSHLQTLQGLAAHMKLLLDSPEHLWRLLERKLYLQAAWLFLLSRVVYKSLSRDDDDVAWIASGIDILDQFPLVQRQWDAVSQFRTQITHKATLSLREPSSPAEVCAILLTLHLLESRPLPEALATFLVQRNKSLATAVSHSNDDSSKSDTPRGHNTAPKNDNRSRKAVVRDIRQKLKSILEIVTSTLGISRAIFLRKSGGPPLMCEALDYIQANEPSSSTSLPNPLRLSSQSLLSTLPSSSHFLLLPLNIRSYKPFVDGRPLLSSATQTQLEQKLSEWFQNALLSVQHVVQAWFSELTSVQEIWEMRTWTRTWLQKNGGVEAEETSRITTVLDTICHQQATTVWGSAIFATNSAFRECLSASLSILNLDPASSDAEPVQYLFQATPPPVTLQTNSDLALAHTSFQRYRSALKRQMACRTPLLDNVVLSIEKNIRSLRDDVIAMQSADEDSRSLAILLTSQFQEEAESLYSAIVDALQSALYKLEDDEEITGVIFLGRLSGELAFSCLLMDKFGSSARATDEFRVQLKTIHRNAIERWENHTISRNIATHWKTSDEYNNDVNYIPDSQVPRPSLALIGSLLSLADTLQRTGSPAHSAVQHELTIGVLQNFMLRLLVVFDEQQAPSTHVTLQVLWDLTLLHTIARSWGTCGEKMGSVLQTRIARLTESLNISDGYIDAEKCMSEHLSRMQILLGVLLPPCALPSSPSNPPGLLSFGSPSLESQYQHTLELVKPSARFSLLLVGNVFTR